MHSADGALVAFFGRRIALSYVISPSTELLAVLTTAQCTMDFSDVGIRTVCQP